MMLSKFQYSNFLDFLGIKFESNHYPYTFGPTVFRGESAATFSFGENPDFEGVSPDTRSPISVQRFRRFLGADSTQATQNFSIGVILDAESDGNEIF